MSAFSAVLKAFGGLVAAGVAGCSLLLAVRAAVNDDRVPRVATVATAGDRVLVITAHPDDEIAFAATIAQAARHGARVLVLCLTRGEASRAAVLDGVVGADHIGHARLADARTGELAAATTALGVSRLEIHDHPDGGLTDHLNMVTDEVFTAIVEHEPTVLLTLDDIIGLYGHPDHTAAARGARAAWERDAAARGVRLYQATLPRRQVRLALRFSPVFRRAAVTAQGEPPVPTTAVRVGSAASAKHAAIRAHRTQQTVLGDIQPLAGVIPTSLYFRIFDREYLHEVAREGS